MSEIIYLGHDTMKYPFNKENMSEPVESPGSSAAAFHIDAKPPANSEGEEKDKAGIRDLPVLYKEVGLTTVETGKEVYAKFLEFDRKLRAEGQEVLLSAYKVLDKVGSKLPKPLQFLVRPSDEPVSSLEDYKKITEESVVPIEYQKVFELYVGMGSKAIKLLVADINRAIGEFRNQQDENRLKAEALMKAKEAPKALPEAGSRG